MATLVVTYPRGSWKRRRIEMAAGISDVMRGHFDFGRYFWNFAEDIESGIFVEDVESGIFVEDIESWNFVEDIESGILWKILKVKFCGRY
ncbi:hypothetical protein CEXT_536961 [Caerostris extrusa]|uniref:Uncharacterized protein n=1 Tax=Caerostris extrusa TaxID=172846 RepID=A0AAV4P569_CAEEX|nr:hypothetical protein CEXT_536961 [Caerostris extrusa]